MHSGSRAPLSSSLRGPASSCSSVTTRQPRVSMAPPIKPIRAAFGESTSATFQADALAAVGNADTNNGPVLGTTIELLVVPATSASRNADLDEHFVIGEDRFEVAGEEVASGDLTGAVRALSHERAAECQHCGRKHRLDDVVVAGATAEVALEAFTNLIFARVRNLVEQAGCCHDHARGAVAALQCSGTAGRLPAWGASFCESRPELDPWVDSASAHWAPMANLWRGRALAQLTTATVILECLAGQAKKRTDQQRNSDCCWTEASTKRQSQREDADLEKCANQPSVPAADFARSHEQLKGAAG
ncbi:hypothetical protein GQR58_029734 [Nymphon striatum]|nr:hypothetical protein GQR58_029734 [Nymphon striatum]